MNSLVHTVNRVATAADLSVPRSLRRPLAIVLGSLLVAVCAHVSIPLWFTPVPVTLQTFAVLLLGLLLSPAVSAAALVLYLAEGAVGLPVFSPWAPPDSSTSSDPPAATCFPIPSPPLSPASSSAASPTADSRPLCSLLPPAACSSCSAEPPGSGSSPTSPSAPSSPWPFCRSWLAIPSKSSPPQPWLPACAVSVAPEFNRRKKSPRPPIAARAFCFPVN